MCGLNENWKEKEEKKIVKMKIRRKNKIQRNNGNWNKHIHTHVLCLTVRTSHLHFNIHLFIHDVCLYSSSSRRSKNNGDTTHTHIHSSKFRKVNVIHNLLLVFIRLTYFNAISRCIIFPWDQFYCKSSETATCMGYIQRLQFPFYLLNQRICI